jgi:signal transduction histidine kinase/HAMP domain-containing protein
MTGLSLRARLTLAIVAAAIVPIGIFAVMLVVSSIVSGSPTLDDNFRRLLILAVAAGILIALFIALALSVAVTGSLRRIATAVERTSAGDLSTSIEVTGDDELARLAESHNRLATVLDRRTREIGAIRVAVEHAPPGDTADALAVLAADAARQAFGMNDAVILLVDQAEIPTEEVVPGVARPVRASLRAGDEILGVFVGRLPPTRTWEKADQDLLELYATEVAVAIRNSQLLARVEAQNEALRDLGEQKDDFFRGVSHNLQTPLARIRATAEGLLGESGDRRAAMIVEQSDRLSRMVRQLMTVTRLEAGTLKPRADVLSVGVRARRAWEALAIPSVEFNLEDRSAGWLAVADVDALDQVLWALLDNAVKYGGGAPITVTIDADPETSRIHLTIGDEGPGVSDEDRERLFMRFARGADEEAGSGSGLGLYVSRELCRAMNGDLVLEPTRPGRGASFRVTLPGEPPTE